MCAIFGATGPAGSETCSRGEGDVLLTHRVAAYVFQDARHFPLAPHRFWGDT
jgi:hypothetical protein